jgi:hypothetical protein
MERWLEHFPREQILVLFYEDIQTRPRALLRELYGFLGVEPDYMPPENLLTRRVNARPSLPMPPEIRSFLEDQLYPLNARLAQLVGRPLPWDSMH